jgi:hypothetical protein
MFRFFSAVTACHLYMMTDQASWLIMEGCLRMRQKLLMPPSAKKKRGRPSEHRSSKELTKRYALEGVKIASNKTGLVASSLQRSYWPIHGILGRAATIKTAILSRVTTLK